ncbi:cytochrome P450 [Myxococcus sp. K15C18031901]|uniref:cytochrome P450 n=1 Tax=Myxococcus dinghuensis TaxID=2906761 RepID=UPI0020A7A90E|nr:cytochrome P450 [Myxococcus dinghuensis]MCP3103984.1 cytochrome P450 [Myxococcus dinghuensis]
MPVTVQKQEETGVPAHAPASRCPHLGAQYNPFVGPHVDNPHPFFERLRREEPVTFSPMLGMWLVSRHDDITRVLREPQRFSSRDMLSSGTRLTDEARDILAQGFSLDHILLGMDPPDHTRLRRLMNRGFTPQRIASAAPLIERKARELVGRFAQRGHADLLEELAYPLPVHVILGVMGVPEEDTWNIKRWSADWQALTFEHVPPEKQPEMARGVLALQRYCVDLIEERRRHPREDLTSHLIETTPEGDTMSLHELVMAIGASMLSAGHESTTSLMANTWKLAMEHGLWKRLREDRALVPKFIEEGSRWDSVQHAMIRTTTEDVELGGVLLPEGARLLLLYGAANRDESLCPHAHKLDLDRDKVPPHLTYGRGTHFCLGAPLARLQVQLTTNILLDHLEAPRLVPGQDFGIWQSIVLRQMKHLKVEWTPSTAATP